MRDCYSQIDKPQSRRPTHINKSYLTHCQDHWQWKVDNVDVKGLCHPSTFSQIGNSNMTSCNKLSSKHFKGRSRRETGTLARIWNKTWTERKFLLQSWKCWWKSYHPGAFPSLKVPRNFLIAAFWPQLNPLENDFVTFQSCPPRGGWWNWTECSPSVEKLQIKICRREKRQRPSHFGISPR